MAKIRSRSDFCEVYGSNLVYESGQTTVVSDFILGTGNANFGTLKISKLCNFVVLGSSVPLSANPTDHGHGIMNVCVPHFYCRTQVKMTAKVIEWHLCLYI